MSGICDLYARAENLEESPSRFFSLLAPDVEWVSKWWIRRGITEVTRTIEQGLQKKWRYGLANVELTSGCRLKNDVRVDCTVAVPIAEPDRHWTIAVFETDHGRITRMFLHSSWMHPQWPYPERVRDKVADLLRAGVPIRKMPPPEKLQWPDDGRNLDGAPKYPTTNDVDAVGPDAHV